jgi:hypothetical protein
MLRPGGAAAGFVDRRRIVDPIRECERRSAAHSVLDSISINGHRGRIYIKQELQVFLDAP